MNPMGVVLDAWVFTFIENIYPKNPSNRSFDPFPLQFSGVNKTKTKKTHYKRTTASSSAWNHRKNLGDLMRFGDSEPTSSFKKHFSWKPYQGTNIFPLASRHFWVDDFPNFPRWDMLIPWKVYPTPSPPVKMGPPCHRPPLLQLPVLPSSPHNEPVPSVTYYNCEEAKAAIKCGGQSMKGKPT